MKKTAVRNLRLCTKDCLCLYVCPTGATDTENSIIDVNKCIGCGACAEACPSKAISLVPQEYPAPQPKKENVCRILNALAQNKADQEAAALKLAKTAEQDGLRRLLKAVAASERLIGEDIMREAGYMLPQSENVRTLLKDMLKNPDRDFPAEAAEKLQAVGEELGLEIKIQHTDIFDAMHRI